jgi:hypothetical protein
MKLTEITYSLGRTIQMEAYQPVNFHASIKADVTDKDDLDEAYNKLRLIVTQQINKDINSIREKKNNILPSSQRKPEILTHPNIPKPLHGIAPRTIKGSSWWNKEREKVYQRYDYHCVACGTHKIDAKGKKWLEAHEYWNIDYKKGIAEVKSIEPLCHYCHNFIHSGRLSEIVGKEKTKEEVIAILEHGFKILADNKLECFPFTKQLAEHLGAKTFGVGAYFLPEEEAEWDEWKLIFEGKEYKSKFKNIDEWSEYYSNLDKPKKAKTNSNAK